MPALISASSPSPPAIAEYRHLLEAFCSLCPDYEQGLVHRLRELRQQPQPPCCFTVPELFFLDYSIKQHHKLCLDDAYYDRLRSYYPPSWLQAMINGRLW